MRKRSLEIVGFLQFSLQNRQLRIGPSAGNATVVITGTNLNGTTAVTFGTLAAVGFTIVSEAEIQAIAPAQSPSTVDITVTSPYGISSTSAADQYTYIDNQAPGVSGLSTTSGAMAGGTGIIITGANFTGATAVDFGQVGAATFVVNSSTQISATIPTGPAGMVDVTVTTPYGTSIASTFDQYTYLAVLPNLTGINPSTGSTAGGDTVTISGTNFTNAVCVYFGGLPATDFTILSDGTITATSPVQAAGTVDVTVVNVSGTSPVVVADQFTFTAASGLPSVTGIAPSSGPVGGGTTVTITGTSFTGAIAVTFGGLLATMFTVNSDTSITAQAPPHAAATVDIQVAGPGGISAAVAADQFTHNSAPPTVTTVSPSSGPAMGGSSAIITGTNFVGATAVNFGTTAAVFVVDSATQITASVPGLSVGTYDVTVTTPAGTSGTSAADQFTAVAPPVPLVVGVMPTSGPTAGGTTVVITGDAFTGATGVLFGKVPATSFSADSDTQITAISPPQVSGTVDIAVTTPSGTSETDPDDQFSYSAAPPRVTGISPTTGPTAGGTAVTITGANLSGVLGVSFGTAAALTVQFVSDNQVVAVSPVAAAGTVDVIVSTVNGASTPSGGDQFTFAATVDTPSVTGLSPSSGPTSGGTTVTITGTNLTGAQTVLFGNLDTQFTVISSSQIAAIAPSQSPGLVDVTIITYGGIWA